LAIYFNKNFIFDEHVERVQKRREGNNEKRISNIEAYIRGVFNIVLPCAKKVVHKRNLGFMIEKRNTSLLLYLLKHPIVC
jgi:hypothetical protein